MPTLAKVSLIKKNTQHHLLNVGSQNLTSTSNLIAHFFFATTSVNPDLSDSINIPCICLALGLGPNQYSLSCPLSVERVSNLIYLAQMPFSHEAFLNLSHWK